MRNLEIQNNESESLLITGWHLTEPPLRFRLTVNQRYGKAGGQVSGDREYSTRNASLESDITAENNVDYISQLGDIVRIFDKNKSPYYLIDNDNQRRIKITPETITPSTRKGLEMRHTPIKIDVVYDDVFWEDLAETVVASETAGLASGASLLCDNLGAVECYPIISITPTELNTNFSLLNTTTGDILTIGSNSFDVGAEIIIDCQLGEIYLDNGFSSIDISSSIADGTGFIFLATGENNIEYQSAFGEINIEITYRNRYAY